jgi:hypothetical protein
METENDGRTKVKKKAERQIKTTKKNEGKCNEGKN